MLIGINVHDELGSSSPYANATSVGNAILHLGPKIVRGISPTDTSAMRWLATQGIGYIMMCRTAPEQTTTALYAPGVQIAQAAKIPVAIEGLNEPDLAKPTSASYPDWVSYTKASQGAIWTAGQALGCTVLGPSVVFQPGAQQLGSVPMDKLNIHTYGWPHTAVPDVSTAIANVRSLSPEAGVWVTEIGASTYLNNWPFGTPDLTEAQQASLTMQGIAHARQLNVEVCVVYELVDQHNGWTDFFASYNREKNFGVFRSDWSPKPIVSQLIAAT